MPVLYRVCDDDQKDRRQIQDGITISSRTLPGFHPDHVKALTPFRAGSTKRSDI